MRSFALANVFGEVSVFVAALKGAGGQQPCLQQRRRDADTVQRRLVVSQRRRAGRARHVRLHGVAQLQGEILVLCPRGESRQRSSSIPLLAEVVLVWRAHLDLFFTDNLNNFREVTWRKDGASAARRRRGTPRTGLDPMTPTAELEAADSTCSPKTLTFSAKSTTM